MNREKIRKIIGVVFPLALVIGAILRVSPAQQAAKTITRDTFLLDTFCELTVYEGGGEKAMQAGMDTLSRFNDLFSPNLESSDLYRINHRTEEQVEIAPETEEMLRIAREICEESGGALEPAIRPLTEIWDFKEKKEIPDAALLQTRLSEVKSLCWDVRDGIFTAEDPAVRIDAGAIAKGYIADQVKAVLVQNGVTSGVINLGGNVLLIGKTPKGEDFPVSIRADKDASEQVFTVLQVSDLSVVTAGTYERCFEQDGIRYHHILDPKTGYPVQNGLISVTVVGPSSTLCDALCTAVFVLGRERGEEFLAAYNRAHGTDYRVLFQEKQS